MKIKEPALGMIELSSIGRGLKVLDAVAKKAPVTVHAAEPLSGGKFMVLFSGEVAPVEESLSAGIEVGDDQVVHTLLIPNLHEQVPKALSGPVEVKAVESLGIVETLSIAATVRAADAAAKEANVQLIQIRLAQGIGGKGFFTLCGPLADVEAAIQKAANLASQGGWLVDWEVIPRPHADALDRFVKRPSPGPSPLGGS